MWIRSQDRKILAEVHYVDINDDNQIWGSGSLLGEYSTEEKALVVLDEIQKKVEYPGSTLVSPTALKNYYRLIPTGQFYQMPQDEDVEA